MSDEINVGLFLSSLLKELWQNKRRLETYLIDKVWYCMIMIKRWFLKIAIKNNIKNVPTFVSAFATALKRQL